MNILVTGSRGQLGSELQELSRKLPDHRFFFYDLPELDITDSGGCWVGCIGVQALCAH